MKKFFILILLGAAGYFGYEYLIKEKIPFEIKADKVISTSNSMDIEAPALMPTHTGYIQGTVKNISDKTVTDILLKYMLDGKPVESRIYSLSPGEQKDFITTIINVRSTSSEFYLDSLAFK